MRNIIKRVDQGRLGKLKHHPAWERIYLSVLFLAKGTDSLAKRLKGVYQDHLISLSERDFLNKYQKENFTSIIDRLKRLESLSVEGQTELASNIVSLYNSVVESQYKD